MIHTNRIQTPWGVADTAKALAHGITWVSTPSHGGYYVPPESNHLITAPYGTFPGFRTFCGQEGWYEEDCDWAAVVITFPELFPPEFVKSAERMRPYLEKRTNRPAPIMRPQVIPEHVMFDESEGAL